ncbi:MAG TPA: FAD-dependent oxidoreductase [Candidatus Limnocylindria bacterium]|nr:FAD-dependent oxidoreductase [Candidatus Limnocylindria bacterium]
MNQLPNAEFIIIGAGAVGVGCAYALAKAGKTDVLVLERADDVGAVTTAQGAGLCGQVRDSAERIRLAMHSVRTFRELQASEVKPDWHEVGSLRIALSEKRAEEFRRLKAAADAADLGAELIDHAEAKCRFPQMEFAGVTSVLWCPSDGYMTPRAVAASYRHNASKLGVKFATATALEGITLKNGRVAGVTTSRGPIECRYVINAAGANAYHVAKLAGLDLPIFPVRHEYFVTVPMDGLTPETPCFRVPELTLYGRVRDGGLLLGGWEPRSLNGDPRAYAADNEPPPVVTDWPVLDSFETSFTKLFPTARAAQKSWVGKGWPTFTPDGRFLIGESSRVPGFVMAGGCNAHGISGSGGIGKLLVESLLDPKPGEYARSLSPDRFTETSWNWDEARRQSAHVYETYYGV